MKNVVVERDIIHLINSGGQSLELQKGTIVTPSAWDKIREYKIRVIYKNEISSKPEKVKHPSEGMIVIGGDHTGYETKIIVKKFLQDLGFDVKDIGTFSKESCDYPDFAREASKLVALKKAEYAVLLDATGIPSAITANKIPGIRAATCYNEFSARSAREHNNANVLVMGAKTLGEEIIKSIIKVFFSTKFGGGRHQRRLDKISEIEKSFFKNS